MPADFVLTLMRSKTIAPEDFMATQTYVLGDGSKFPSQRFKIKSLKVGNKTLENVIATIVPAKAEILLGQSEEGSDAPPRGGGGALGGFSQEMLQLGEHLRDRVEIGTVGRQEE
jgi:hypothetical protein